MVVVISICSWSEIPPPAPPLAQMMSCRSVIPAPATLSSEIPSPPEPMHAYWRFTTPLPAPHTFRSVITRPATLSSEIPPPKPMHAYWRFTAPLPAPHTFRSVITRPATLRMVKIFQPLTLLLLLISNLQCLCLSLWWKSELHKLTHYFRGTIDNAETLDAFLAIVWCRRHQMQEEVIVPFVVALMKLLHEFYLRMHRIGGVGKNIFSKYMLLWPGCYGRVKFNGLDGVKSTKAFGSLRNLTIAEKGKSINCSKKSEYA